MPPNGAKKLPAPALNCLNRAYFVVYSPTTTKKTTHLQARQADICCITVIRTTKMGGSSANTLQNMTNTSDLGIILDRCYLKNALFTSGGFNSEVHSETLPVV